ncbi:hypothetical protein ONS95_013682 [Cadophora gregata]|uniref:uncharacterized protein n=1 Tax=Cadophora gregata TaxID=51156 RepID=UPI0026DD8258|nr:uncharacterized protein ONS95_013682 [Cadophora gregata]KAK0114182.1 hypothetical protein ONS95_013682 [Cadophora gregata]
MPVHDPVLGAALQNRASAWHFTPLPFLPRRKERQTLNVVLQHTEISTLTNSVRKSKYNTAHYLDIVELWGFRGVRGLGLDNTLIVEPLATEDFTIRRSHPALQTPSLGAIISSLHPSDQMFTRTT